MARLVPRRHAVPNRTLIESTLDGNVCDVVPRDLIGQSFLLRRLGNDRHALLGAISIRLQQEALIALLNNFNTGRLLRHHQIWFFGH
jgi:hypothetical protein